MGGLSESALGGVSARSVPKQLVLLVVASVAAIFFKNELVHGLNLLIQGHNTVSHWMAMVFSGDVVGRIIQGVIALLLIPMAIGFVASIVYWVVRKAAFPHAFLVIWATWLVLLVTLLAQTGMVSA